ncbi:MAG: transposase [Actinobacteria bacterium]|nr:transposase [Actinomycetota bacterium]MCG2817908.1 transposase [Actinomycetes bacterium]MBU4219755.1 transposase [Actinomycetota bacterium]MBU4357837.1 transposase [Actinomycetota bacterium]MBU4392664.1 transposase [Actinomycetota bacterium]
MKQKIFLENDDRLSFFGTLFGVISRYEWSCYTYCLMDNHYHLLVETHQANLSEGMHKLNSDYCNRFNSKYGGVGHVLQGRFYSSLIENEAHLMETIRYTALNPVSGGLVRKPGQWRWSSYRAISGLGPVPDFLDVEYTLGLFSDNNETARKAYLHFVADGLLRDQAKRTTLQEIFRGATDRHQRNNAIHVAYFEHDYTMTELATYLKLNRTTVGRVLGS